MIEEVQTMSQDKQELTALDETSNEQLPELAEEFVIENLETLKVMTDPLRLQILELFLEGPRTVKQIAAELAITPTKLYYHINLLEEHGLIRVVNTRVVSGIIEKQYFLTAYSFRPAPALLSPGTAGDEGFSQLVSTVLGRTADDIVKSIKAGLIDPAHGDPEHPTVMLIQNLARLTEEQAQAFIARLRDLLEEVGACDTQNENDKMYGLTIAFYPSTKRVSPRTLRKAATATESADRRSQPNEPKKSRTGGKKGE
jgi:DNA-binding transcriptional ArsR family regulator